MNTFIFPPGGGGPGQFNQQQRPPRRRKNRSDKRAESEKKKKEGEKKKKKELTFRIFFAISIFAIPIAGLAAAFALLGFGLGLVNLTEISARLMRMLVTH